MMSLKNTNNISYLVPSVIIDTFLEDIKDGKVDGFGKDGLIINNINNDSVKDYFGLKNGDGILITKVPYAVDDFKVNDIILEIDGKVVANDGTIDSSFGRVNCNLVLHKKQIGDKVRFKILRDKEVISFNYTIKKTESLIKREFDKEPRYLIFGGLTFTPLTKNYLLAIGRNSSGIDNLFYHKDKSKEFDEAVVWMQDNFPHKVNRGYSSQGYIVETVNGIKVRNFNHFVSLIDSLSTQFVVIDTMEKEKIILNVKEARKSFEDLRKIYRLNSDRAL